MPKKHTVRQGECILSIAAEHGFFPDTVWNDPANSKLQQPHKHPGILHTGDVVVIPDKRVKEESGVTEQRHRFRRKGVPAKLRLRILEQSEQDTDDSQEPRDTSDDLHSVIKEPEPRSMQEVPRAGVPYVLEIGGKLINDKTDGDGWIVKPIPPNMKSAKLFLDPGTPKESIITLNLGYLNPADSVSGAKQRLNNLGFFCNDDSDTLSADFQSALAEFQEQHGLTATAKLDQPTVDELTEGHGG